MHKYDLTAYINYDQAFQGNTRETHFNECNDFVRYTYTTSIVMSSKELADWMLVEYLKELSKEYCGGVWVALWNGDMYLGQFLFNTDVCIPEPIPQVWTEFMEEVK